MKRDSNTYTKKIGGDRYLTRKDKRHKSFSYTIGDGVGYSLQCSCYYRKKPYRKAANRRVRRNKNKLEGMRGGEFKKIAEVKWLLF